MVDIYPVDYATAVGRVRKLIPDITPVVDPANPTEPAAYIWSDGALQSFIDDELPAGWLDGDPTPRYSIWRAAAGAMIATANDVNLTLKKLVTEDLQTDGPAVADKLIKAAAVLLGRADDDQMAGDNAEVFLTVFPERWPVYPPEATEWPNYAW